MLPSRSKQAPCGQMNCPGMNVVARLRPQRVVPRRRVRVAEVLRRPGCSRSSSVTRPCRSGMTTVPLCSSKWHGSRKPATKSTCVPSSVKRCSRLLRRSATTSSGVVAARVDPDAVRFGQLSRRRAASAEGADVFALAVVLVDEVRAVAVADVDVAVRRDREVGRVVALRRAVRAGLRVGLDVGRALNCPDDLAASAWP